MANLIPPVPFVSNISPTLASVPVANKYAGFPVFADVKFMKFTGEDVAVILNTGDAPAKNAWLPVPFET